MRLGEYNMSSLEDGPHEDVRVVRFDKHFDYNDKYGTNDIAILHLVRNVKITSNIWNWSFKVRSVKA